MSVRPMVYLFPGVDALRTWYQDASINRLEALNEWVQANSRDANNQEYLAEFHQAAEELLEGDLEVEMEQHADVLHISAQLVFGNRMNQIGGGDRTVQAWYDLLNMCEWNDFLRPDELALLRHLVTGRCLIGKRHECELEYVGWLSGQEVCQLHSEMIRIVNLNPLCKINQRPVTERRIAEFKTYMRQNILDMRERGVPAGDAPGESYEEILSFYDDDQNVREALHKPSRPAMRIRCVSNGFIEVLAGFLKTAETQRSGLWCYVS